MGPHGYTPVSDSKVLGLQDYITMPGLENENLNRPFKTVLETLKDLNTWAQKIRCDYCAQLQRTVTEPGAGTQTHRSV